MPALLALVLPLAACRDERPRSCEAVGGVPRETFEGAFLYAVDAIEVVEGDYRPPAPPPPTIARSVPSEDYVLWALEDVDAVVALYAERIDLTPSSAPRGTCGGDFEYTVPQPPWNERSHVAVDTFEELGTLVGALDPSVRVEPAYSVPEYPGPVDERLGMILDEDGRGFVLRVEYWVTPAGCEDLACASRVRVTHRFRRGD